MGRYNGYLQALDEKSIQNVLEEWLGNAVTRRATLQIKDIDRDDAILINVEEAIRRTLIAFLKLPEDFELRIWQDPDFNYQVFLEIGDRDALPLAYYSDGFRNLLYLIIDLVWRASQLHPWLTLDGIAGNVFGVVMIDEIDLHLHHQWQSEAIPMIQRLFPNVQFFITTHSPTVVANFRGGNLYILRQNNEIIEVTRPYFGKEVDDVQHDILGAPERNIEVQQKLDDTIQKIEAGYSDDVYSPALNELREILGADDPDIIRAETMIEWNEYLKTSPDAVYPEGVQ